MSGESKIWFCNVKEQGEESQLLSPAVGYFFPAASSIALAPQTVVGWISVLGEKIEVRCPQNCSGLATLSSFSELPAKVQFATPLFSVAPLSSQVTSGGKAANTAISNPQGDVFCAPSAGRIYLRPAPDKAPFITVGHELLTGHVVALLEVMKSFSRIAFAHSNAANKVRISAILVKDGDDVTSGQPLFRYERTS